MSMEQNILNFVEIAKEISKISWEHLVVWCRSKAHHSFVSHWGLLHTHRKHTYTCKSLQSTLPLWL